MKAWLSCIHATTKMITHEGWGNYCQIHSSKWDLWLRCGIPIPNSHLAAKKRASASLPLSQKQSTTDCFSEDKWALKIVKMYFLNRYRYQPKAYLVKMFVFGQNRDVFFFCLCLIEEIFCYFFFSLRCNRKRKKILIKGKSSIRQLSPKQVLPMEDFPLPPLVTTVKHWISNCFLSWSQWLPGNMKLKTCKSWMCILEELDLVYQ